MKSLRVLMVEDSEKDAALVLRELQKAGYSPVHRRVETAKEMTDALKSEYWDIVLSDYVLPGFGGLAALGLIHDKGLDLPFIVVSGQIGEDVAVSAMKAGAHDYIMKGNLKRLGPAIERELAEAENRKMRRQAEEDLKRSAIELRALAQRLLQALSEMMASLGRAGAQAGMAPLDRLQGEMSRQTGELDRILAEQKEILAQTEKIDKETKRIVDEEIEKRLNHSRPQLQEALEGLNRSLPPEQKEAVDELQRLLQEGKLERFSQVAKELEKELSGRPKEQKVIGDLRDRMEGLSPDPKGVVAPEDKAKFPGLSSSQDNLKERTMALGEKLDLLSQLFPGLDTEILRDLKEATGSMGEASGKLKGEDAPGAIPPEQEVIRRLTKSQQAMQQMAQQMAMQRYAAQWGPQLVYDPRPAWYYGPWIPMPTLPQPEVNRPRERGYTGLDREEFEPPSKDAYRVPKIFRDKVLEGLKEETPSQYKRRVERYFKGLSE